MQNSGIILVGRCDKRGAFAGKVREKMRMFMLDFRASIVIALMLILTGAPLAAARDHLAPSQQQSNRQTAQAEPKVVRPSVEYIRVKMGKSIFLDPPENEEPKVYVRIRDTSGHGFQLQRQVLQLLKENGFGRARSLKTADYVLQANLLFAEEVSEAQLQKINDSDYDQNITDFIGAAVVGGAVGGAADSVIGDNSGLGAGSVVGSILGIVVAGQEAAKQQEELARKKATKFFSAVVDIEVRQKTEGQVVRKGYSNLDQQTAQNSSQGSLLGNDSLSESDRTRTEEYDRYTAKSNWVRYRARVVASAKGKHIRLVDIQQQMTHKISSALGGLF